VRIFLGDEDVSAEALDTTLIDSTSVISIVPAIAGGCGRSIFSFCKNEMTMSEIQFSKEELERYSRHLIIPEFNIEGQRKLKASRVLVIGTGGLGSPLLLYLTAAGIGTIGLVDFDTVDQSNLQRQVLFTVSDVGKHKVDAAIERLKV
jgi:hypothetical protein